MNIGWRMVLLSLSLSSVLSGEDYEGYRVLRSVPKTKTGLQFLVAELARQGENCQPWKVASKLGLPTDIMCNNATASVMLDRLAGAGIQSHTIIDNVGHLVREEAETQRRHREKRNTEENSVRMNWDTYQRYETIVSWMEELAEDNPDFITLTDMGKSHEGRKILMLKVGTSPRGAETRAVWVDGGIHAREWIAPATSTFLLSKIVEVFRTGDKSNCDVEAVQAVDWYIAPLLNPDGYEWSHTNYRMWRKNRSAPPSGSSCYGVDLNRNWDVIGFGLGVTSSNPCSDTYKGTQPGSEPETQAVAATIQKYKDNIRIYLTFHSYGQYWLTSWGYKTELPVDNEKLVKVGREACDAIKCVTPSRSYTVGSAGAIFYIAGGASDDYAKAAAEIPYSFTVELPDTGSYGFLLPASQIKTVGAELWAATGVLAREAARHNTGPDPARQSEELQDQRLGLSPPR